MKNFLTFFFLFLAVSTKIFSQTTLLEEGFEGTNIPFSVIDEDGDGNQWGVSTIANRTGLKGAQVSYNPTGNIDWLITSNYISIPASASSVTMSLWARSNNPMFLERFKIGYSTDNVNWNFDPVNENVPGTWTNYNFTKTILAGQQVKFAIVCVSVDEFALNIDDIKISAQTSQSLPVLTTRPAENTSSYSTVTGGIILQSGTSSITAKGVCWSTSPNPTISNSPSNNVGSGSSNYFCTVTGLASSTTYYVRAYATNASGTAYGDQINFTTLSSGGFPVISTNQVTSITTNSAVSGGNITQSLSAVSTRGVCWSTNQNPTTNDSKTIDGSGSGQFTSNLTGLLPNTTYYIRAYATNNVGTGYGAQVSFTTLNFQVPVVQTNQISGITVNSAQGGGNVTQSSSNVTQRGICWSTNQNPTISDNKTNNGTGTGSFTSSMTGLSSNTTYYVRAYATNSAGTGYGNQVSFTTLGINAPTVETSQVSGITLNTAECGGNVIQSGNSFVTARGVCWNTSPNPTTSNNKTSNGVGTGSFTSSLTGLVPNTIYYVRAYATNSIGVSYGAQETFSTLSPPTIQTINISAITTTSAVSGGNITSQGASAVTNRGVCWSTNPAPTISDNKTSNGSGTGSFTSFISNLSPSTTYYVRSYATTNLGTTYGNQISFTTLACTTNPQVYLENLGFLDQTLANTLGNEYFFTFELPPSINFNPANPQNLQDLGKPIRFKVKCKNKLSNQNPITDGICVIRTTDPNIIITDSTAGLNNVQWNGSAWSSNEFEIILSPNVTSSYTAKIDFIVKVGTNQFISSCIPIPIRPFSTFNGISNAGPNIGTDFYLVNDKPPGSTDSNGNGNNICETNETIETKPAINNLSEFEAVRVAGFFRNLDNFSGIDILNNQTGINNSTINAQWWYNFVGNVPAPIPPASSGASAVQKGGEFDFVFKYNYPATYAFDLYLILTGGFRIFGPGSTPVLMSSSAKIAYNQGQPLAPDAPVQVFDQIKEDIISIYPNPSNGIFIVKKPEILAGQHHILKVYGLLGQNVMSSDFYNSSIQFDLSSLGAKGVYIIEITDLNNAVLSRKKVLIQ